MIRVTFFIHTEKAAFGMLYGVDRDFSLEPDVPYRMELVWDTKSGSCAFTVSASSATPEKTCTADGAGLLVQLKETFIPEQGTSRALYTVDRAYRATHHAPITATALATAVTALVSSAHPMLRTSDLRRSAHPVAARDFR
ncbi:hypothetical protein OG523_03530 [Streptomyces virginiae]|uniref:hypothetical protein n=1 Tax=Streptomyces virginiae TaxID=1961 RepID=UPI002E3222CD|nr:hypothetical protein [Streptomyces virginiae]